MDIEYPYYSLLPRLRYRFCPLCKTELSTRVIDDDGITRIVCPSCNWVHYPTNALGVNILIVSSAGVVAIHPSGEDGIALPGGHVEYGESPHAAAIREAYEETGLTVEVIRCLGWYFEPNPEYPGPMVSFMFETRAVDGGIKHSQEGIVAIHPVSGFPDISSKRYGSRRLWATYLNAQSFDL